jgi:ribosomal protein S18 acetylase RimI-like enzyme
METTEVAYKRRTAEIKDILAHLEACNEEFHPPLSERVGLEEYARKVFENAVTFEAWSGSFLVGLVAAYFNNDAKQSAYITNVSVLHTFLRLGIASRLLKECVEYAIEKSVREISLEVNVDNESAISMYRKFNFIQDGDINGFLKMKLITRPV